MSFSKLNMKIHFSHFVLIDICTPAESQQTFHPHYSSVFSLFFSSEHPVYTRRPIFEEHKNQRALIEINDNFYGTFGTFRKASGLPKLEPTCAEWGPDVSGLEKCLCFLEVEIFKVSENTKREGAVL